MYAVVDVETTGFSPAEDRIIEIGIVGLNRDAEPEWEWGTLVNPERDTGHGLAVQVHQIYPHDVEHAPTFDQYAGYIMHLLNGRVIVGHNVNFDWSMLVAEFDRCGWKIPDTARLCTMDLARRAGAPSGKLADCCEWLGIQATAEHEALADARATAHLARTLLEATGSPRQHLIDAAHNSPRWPPIPVQQWKPTPRPQPEEAVPPPGARLRLGDRVAVTGPLSRPRDEWRARIIEAGLQYRSTVSHVTDWLVVAHAPTGSAKSRHAAEFGVNIVSERHFEQLLETFETGQ